MAILFTLRIVRITTLAFALVWILWLVLARAGAVQAAGVVTNCTGQGLADAMNIGSGLITFNCGPDPVIITITQNGGLNVISGRFFTIDGSNNGNLVTLSGAHANRLFDVRVGGALTLTNIILTDGYQDGIHGNLPDLGGAILDEGISLVLDNVIIRNSQSKTSGGALTVITGTVVVKNSLIENNQSGYGGGIDSGGPLTLINTLTLISTTVRSNQVITAGGGLDVAGTVVISNSQIVSNTANGTGGAGGAILLNRGVLSVTQSILSGNSATYAGGAIRDGGGQTIVQDSLIEDNQSDYGGGIDSIGTLTLINTIVSNNQALANNGGGLDVGGTVVISNSQIVSNTANGMRPGGGGGISITGSGRVSISGSRLDANQTPTKTDTLGGAINNLGVLTVTKSTLSGNSAFVGGGIYNHGTARVDNSTFSRNSAYLDGGGIDNEDSGAVMLDTSTLSSNSAIAGGGIYNSPNSTATLNNSTLSGNSASYGGGIRNSRATVTVTNSTLSGNPAYAGGGIYNDEVGTVTLDNSTISGNSAASNGGGIYNQTLGTVTLNKSTLSGNSANSGGGIFNDRYDIYRGTATLNNSTLSGNSANSGGGIFNSGRATLTNVTLNNSVSLTGTAHNLYLASGVLTLTNTIVNFNAAYGANCFGAGIPTSVSLGHNLSNDTSCATFLIQAGDQNNNPAQLGPLANNGGFTLTHLPLPPIVNGVGPIDNGSCPNGSFDQRGVMRPQGAACDIGAVEYRTGELTPWLYLPLLMR